MAKKKPSDTDVPNDNSKTSKPKAKTVRIRNADLQAALERYLDDEEDTFNRMMLQLIKLKLTQVGYWPPSATPPQT